MWRTFLAHVPMANIGSEPSTPRKGIGNGHNGYGDPGSLKSSKTLAEADDDEDAMDIFGLSSQQYLYTVHIYQAKNIPRSKELTEPNVYVSIEFNQCKSGNRYQTSIVYNSIDPIFNASIFELAERTEIDNITLTVYHRSNTINGHNKDELIGSIVMNVDKFTAWDKWIWLPIIGESDGMNKIYDSPTNNGLFYDDIKSYTGMMQLKFEYIGLDKALMLHQNKELHEYSHIIGLHIHQYVPYDYTVINSRDHVNNNCKQPPVVKFMYPLLQIHWKYDEMFSTQFAQKIHNNTTEDGNVDTYKWEESHYIYAQLRTDDKKSQLRFNILDDGMVCLYVSSQRHYKYLQALFLCVFVPFHRD